MRSEVDWTLSREGEGEGEGELVPVRWVGGCHVEVEG